MDVKRMRDEGMTLVEIAEATGHHRTTIAKWIRAGGPPEKRAAAVERVVLTDRWQRRIEQLVAAQPALLSTSIHDLLAAERFDGSYITVARAVRAIRGPRSRPGRCRCRLRPPRAALVCASYFFGITPPSQQRRCASSPGWFRTGAGRPAAADGWCATPTTWSWCAPAAGRPSTLCGCSRAIWPISVWSPAPAKTRIVHLREGGEGVDFLGFHHRMVRGNTRHSRHLVFLARWPSRKAMRHARDRIGAITVQSRLAVPVAHIVRDINRFLRGWAGYFRYGNSAAPSCRSGAMRSTGWHCSWLNVTSSTATTAGRWSSTCHRITWD